MTLFVTTQQSYIHTIRVRRGLCDCILRVIFLLNYLSSINIYENLQTLSTALNIWQKRQHCPLYLKNKLTSNTYYVKVAPVKSIIFKVHI